MTIRSSPLLSGAALGPEPGGRAARDGVVGSVVPPRPLVPVRTPGANRGRCLPAVSRARVEAVGALKDLRLSGSGQRGRKPDKRFPAGAALRHVGARGACVSGSRRRLLASASHIPQTNPIRIPPRHHLPVFPKSMELHARISRLICSSPAAGARDVRTEVDSVDTVCGFMLDSPGDDRGQSLGLGL